MQIKHLKISRFRGISALEWVPKTELCCLIGSGDSTKSTVLDAIEAVLSPRWQTFTESDFHGCDTAAPIVIEVTVGELSKALLSDGALGLYIRGYAPLSGAIHDEPIDDDIPVLTVRLTVDATMEATWEVHCERAQYPRYLSNRDRALFGLVRLSGEDARHLTWAPGSVLSKLTDDGDQAAAVLAAAQRIARENADLSGIEGFATASNTAQQQASILGAYVSETYAPGLELGRGGFSSSSIALHDGAVPLRLAGLGTRRLATLAIQRAAISDGAIILVDEIEHGLEPHRIIGAIAALKNGINAVKLASRPVGQIFLTTHSDVTIGEVDGPNLYSVWRWPRTAPTQIRSPSDPASITKILKNNPRTLFAKRILLVEGKTELGLMLGIRHFFAERHGSCPVEQRGAAIDDGNGHEAIARALALFSLGYTVSIFRDSDRPPIAAETAELLRCGIPVHDYGVATGFNFESAVFNAAPMEQLQQLIDFARVEKGTATINSAVRIALGIEDWAAAASVLDWELHSPLDLSAIRSQLAALATGGNWFKKLQAGREIAPIVWTVALQNPTSPLARCLFAVEAWLYG